MATARKPKLSKQPKLTEGAKVLRIEEFAQRLHISVWTARQWVYTRKIASTKPGKHLLIPASEVDRLIRENRQRALSPRSQ